MNDESLGLLREARAKMLEAQEKVGRSRELSLAITKVDEAILWRQEDIKFKNPVNESNGS